MITVAIPTYNRGAILVETLAHLRALQPDEILVVDQTRVIPSAVEGSPATAEGGGSLDCARDDTGVRVIRLPEPSIPHAMNVALQEASNEIVLFLDDDVIPSPNLLREHLAAHRDESLWAVVGQVLQPGQEPVHVEQTPKTAIPDLAFPFHSDTPRTVENVMAGNLSVKRTRALSIGGFDENFFGVAYRFETDFARRIVAAGGVIRFEPKASIRHLQIPTGGVRAYGDHRRSASPAHSIGDYYFGRLHAPSFARYAASRLRSNVLTRYHLTHPWFLPAKLLGELRGLLGSARLVRGGRKLRNKP